MKNFFIFLLFFIILIGIVNAQEAPKYNFGTMQAIKELNVAPGETAVTKLYFYNIYGNRITHISLSIEETPENWDVSIEPALHNTTVSVSGVPTTIEENLYVEPSEAVEEIPTTVPEGIEYISSSVGYIGAKPVEIKIKVPPNEKLGEIGKIKINALAEWLGQAGTVALKQTRDFDYTINIVSQEFTEEVIEEPEEIVEEKETEIVPTGAVVVKTEKSELNNVYIAGIIVLIGVVTFLLFKLKKKRQKKPKKK